MRNRFAFVEVAQEPILLRCTDLQSAWYSRCFA
jgi:hypothetical protein